MISTRRLFAVGLVTALLIAVIPSAHAADPAVDLQSVKKRIESLSNEIDTTTSNRSTLAREIQSTQQRMDDVLASMTSLRTELITLEANLSQRRHALRDVRTDLSVQYQSLAMTRSDLGVARDAATHYAIESYMGCLLYTSPSPRDRTRSRMPSSA